MTKKKSDAQDSRTKGLSRRDFVTTGAAGLGAAALLDGGHAYARLPR